MATTLSYGYIKNQTGDKGSAFFPDLEFNIQRINDHSHNGVNSVALSSANIESITQNVLAVAWVAVVGHTGTFSQTVTVPAGINLNKHTPRFKHNTSGEVLYLSYTILTTETFEVFINDDTVALQLAYG